jgi:hypothetical protein
MMEKTGQWTDKRLVQLVSTSHYRTVVNTGRKGRRTALEINCFPPQ